MRFWWNIICCFVLACLMSAAARAQDKQQLVLMYNDLAPFVEKQGDRVSGYLGDYITSILAAADVQVLWKNVPWDRQLPALQQNTANMCVVAVFKTPEREEFVRYTAPIGSDYGFVLVGPRGHKGLLRHTTFENVVDDQTLRPIMQTQTVYSSYINGLVNRRTFPKVEGSMLRLLRAIGSGKYDYMIVLKSRAENLLKGENLTKDFALFTHYSDLGKFIFYHMGCSLSTDEILFSRIDEEIMKWGPLLRPEQ
jgi:polar amino acid transport system substrate-binding protein